MESIINTLAATGPLGTLAAILLAIGWGVHSLSQADQCRTLRDQLSDSKQTTQDYQARNQKMTEMIEKNTEALTRTAMSQEACTNALKEMGHAIHDAIQLLHQVVLQIRK